MNFRWLLTCAVVSVALLHSNAEAAPAKKPAVTKRARAAKVTPVQVLSAQLVTNRPTGDENLAAACNRASFKNLAIALNMNSDWLSLPKGEFETSEAFQGRQQKLVEAFGEPVLVCERLSANDDISFDYNADRMVFEGSFLLSHNIWRDSRDFGSYRTKTRMGVPVTVKASADLEYNLAIKSARMEQCMRTSPVKFEVASSIDSAPALKGRGRIYYLLHLVPPFIEKQDTPGSPTLDDPYDVYTTTLTVYASLEKVGIIDASGAEVWSCNALSPSARGVPEPSGSPAYWVSSNDYPSRALREKRAGVVGFEIEVNKEGMPQRCTVVASSGSPDLDETTCSNLMRRARFTPGTDAAGNPVAGVYRSSVRWSVPTD